MSREIAKRVKAGQKIADAAAKFVESYGANPESKRAQNTATKLLQVIASNADLVREAAPTPTE